MRRIVLKVEENMGQPRHFFTVVAGRSGQATLTEILRRYVPGCYPAFEEPMPRVFLPGHFGRLEYRFRRRFIETHELLGRGKVLKAFEEGNYDYINRIVKRRLRIITSKMQRHRSDVYFDVSKFFARGLHRGFLNLIPQIGLLRLVRDPVANMRSFLNRSKEFRLDNSLPDARSNILRLRSHGMSAGELYLWAWCELYLRFEQMIQESGVTRWAELRTEHLDDPTQVEKAFRELGLEFLPIQPIGRINTNFEMGFQRTEVDRESIATFERFMTRLESNWIDKIRYFDGYDPSKNQTVGPDLS